MEFRSDAVMHGSLGSGFVKDGDSGVWVPIKDDSIWGCIIVPRWFPYA